MSKIYKNNLTRSEWYTILLKGTTLRGANGSRSAVSANALTVNGSGADYVFDSAFHFPSLSTVRQYIDNHHHLPDIPSQGDMLTNRLSVGTNQTRLLEKLTLYLMEEDNELQSLNSKLQSLKVKYDLLENLQSQSIDSKRKKKRWKDKMAPLQVLTHYQNLPDGVLPLRHSADFPPVVEGTNTLTPQNSHP